MAMSLADFIRQALVVKNGGSITIVRTREGKFQASVQKGRSSTFSVEINADPVDALWNALVPYQMRRPGSGPPFQDEKHLGSAEPVTTQVKDDPAPPQIDLEEAIAAATADPTDPLEDLLG